MRSDQPLAEALRAALLERARKLAKRLRKAEEGDPQAVHEARTILRRLRQGFIVMGRTVLDPGAAGEMSRRLHRLEKLLGPARDADVLLRSLRGWLTHSRSPARAGIRPLIEIVARRRRRMVGPLAGELHRGRVRHLARDIRRLMRRGQLSAMPAFPAGAGVRPTLVRHFVAEEAWRGYEEVLAYEHTSRTSGAEAEIIHKLRSACRSFRYRLELFDGALPEEASFIVATLRALQERLGALHDCVVAVDTTEKLLSKGKLRRDEAIDAYLRTQRVTRERLRIELGSAWRRLTLPALRDAIAGVARKGTFNVGGFDSPGSGSPGARTTRGKRTGANASGP